MPPATPEQLFARLAALGLQAATITHPPMFTVADSRSLRGTLPGAHCKCLFLRDKKGSMWLVATAEDRAVDLKALAARIGAGRLSFGSPERLMAHLGVMPGSVTPFALINDTGHAVTPVIDRALLEADIVNFHPLVNTATTSIRPADLIRFIQACGHAPVICDLGG
jgi:Ala-tRNA(Pro) deacylase